MKRLIDKYTAKLCAQGLAQENDIVMIALDAEMASNRPAGGIRSELEKVFESISITSLLFAAPAEPYRSIIGALTSREPERLIPTDCETRTFFHDIPVISRLDAGEIARALSERKAAIIRDHGIVSCGTVSPEQAFISFSSVCFSTFVKYFTDVMFLLEDCIARRTAPGTRLRKEFDAIIGKLHEEHAPEDVNLPELPLTSEDAVYDAIVRTGKALVGHRLVDSFFGNISSRFGDHVYITQTGSSLDELEGTIDAVPMDGSSSAGITASSELSAHLAIYRASECRTIVHGHPKFTVIMSMSCRTGECDLSTCYRTCEKKRETVGVPVVSGEIGTGPTGLVRTVPRELAASDAAIVYGHGVFTTGRDDFHGPFLRMRRIESDARREYLEKIRLLFSASNPSKI